jgi:hypothetical protein
MALSDTAIKNAKPGTKPIKLADEKGLYLLISPAGGKWWVLGLSVINILDLSDIGIED